MCDQTEIEYKAGQVVWVKLGTVWWPAQVQNESDLSEEVTQGLRKKPIAVVKFFNEDKYWFVKNLEEIYLYNSFKRLEFIKKGMDAYRNKLNNMTTFPDDVLVAESRTGGDKNILNDPRIAKTENYNYQWIFNGKKGKAISPKAGNSFSGTSRGTVTSKSTSKPLSKLVNGISESSVFSLTDQDINYRCDFCNFACNRLSAYLTHKSFFRNRACALNKCGLNFVKKEKSPLKRKIISNSGPPKQKVKRKSEPGDKTDIVPQKKRATKTKESQEAFEAMREKILQDWDDDEEEEKKKSDSSKEICESTPATATTSKDIVSSSSVAKQSDSLQKSCFDFEENDDAINLDENLKFGQKLPRVVSNEKSKIKDRSESHIMSHTGKDNLEKNDNFEAQFSILMSETEVPSVPSVPKSFLLDSSALPASSGKAEIPNESKNIYSSNDVQFEEKITKMIESPIKRDDKLANKHTGDKVKVEELLPPIYDLQAPINLLGGMNKIEHESLDSSEIICAEYLSEKTEYDMDIVEIKNLEDLKKSDNGILNIKKNGISPISEENVIFTIKLTKDESETDDITLMKESNKLSFLTGESSVNIVPEENNIISEREASHSGIKEIVKQVKDNCDTTKSEIEVKIQQVETEGTFKDQKLKKIADLTTAGATVDIVSKQEDLITKKSNEDIKKVTSSETPKSDKNNLPPKKHNVEFPDQKSDNASKSKLGSNNFASAIDNSNKTEKKVSTSSSLDENIESLLTLPLENFSSDDKSHITTETIALKKELIEHNSQQSSPIKNASQKESQTIDAARELERCLTDTETILPVLKQEKTEIVKVAQTSPLKDLRLTRSPRKSEIRKEDVNSQKTVSVETKDFSVKIKEKKNSSPKKEGDKCLESASKFSKTETIHKAASTPKSEDVGKVIPSQTAENVQVLKSQHNVENEKKKDSAKNSSKKNDKVIVDTKYSPVGVKQSQCESTKNKIHSPSSKKVKHSSSDDVNSTMQIQHSGSTRKRTISSSGEIVVKKLKSASPDGKKRDHSLYSKSSSGSSNKQNKVKMTLETDLDKHHSSQSVHDNSKKSKSLKDPIQKQESSKHFAKEKDSDHKKDKLKNQSAEKTTTPKKSDSKIKPSREGTPKRSHSSNKDDKLKIDKSKKDKKDKDALLLSSGEYVSKNLFAKEEPLKTNSTIDSQCTSNKENKKLHNVGPKLTESASSKKRETDSDKSRVVEGVKKTPPKISAKDSMKELKHTSFSAGKNTEMVLEKKPEINKQSSIKKEEGSEKKQKIKSVNTLDNLSFDFENEKSCSTVKEIKTKESLDTSNISSTTFPTDIKVSSSRISIGQSLSFDFDDTHVSIKKDNPVESPESKMKTASSSSLTALDKDSSEKSNIVLTHPSKPVSTPGKSQVSSKIICAVKETLKPELKSQDDSSNEKVTKNIPEQVPTKGEKKLIVSQEKVVDTDVSLKNMSLKDIPFPNDKLDNKITKPLDDAKNSACSIKATEQKTDVKETSSSTSQELSVSGIKPIVEKEQKMILKTDPPASHKKCLETIPSSKPVIKDTPVSKSQTQSKDKKPINDHSSVIQPIVVPPPSALQSKPDVKPTSSIQIVQVESSNLTLPIRPSAGITANVILPTSSKLSVADSSVTSSLTGISQGAKADIIRQIETVQRNLTPSEVQNMELDINSMPFVIDDSIDIPLPSSSNIIQKALKPINEIKVELVKPGEARKRLLTGEVTGKKIISIPAKPKSPKSSGTNKIIAPKKIASVVKKVSLPDLLKNASSLGTLASQFQTVKPSDILLAKHENVKVAPSCTKVVFVPTTTQANKGNRIIFKPAESTAKLVTTPRIIANRRPVLVGSKVVTAVDSNRSDLSCTKENPSTSWIVTTSSSGSAGSPPKRRKTSDLDKTGSTTELSQSVLAPRSKIQLVSGKGQIIFTSKGSKVPTSVPQLKLVPKLQSSNIMLSNQKLVPVKTLDSKSGTTTQTVRLIQPSKEQPVKDISNIALRGIPQSPNILQSGAQKKLIRGKHQILNIPSSLVSQEKNSGNVAVVQNTPLPTETMSTLVINVNDSNMCQPMDSQSLQPVATNTEKLIYLEPSSSLVNNSFLPDKTVPNVITPASGQDILAKALADTQVLQSDTTDCPLDPALFVEQPLYAATTLTHNSLETSLTLNQPIMTPAEVSTSGTSNFQITSIPPSSYLSLSGTGLKSVEVQPSMPLLSDDLDVPQTILIEEPSTLQSSSSQITFLTYDASTVSTSSNVQYSQSSESALEATDTLQKQIKNSEPDKTTVLMPVIVTPDKTKSSNDKQSLEKELFKSEDVTSSVGLIDTSDYLNISTESAQDTKTPCTVSVKNDLNTCVSSTITVDLNEIHLPPDPPNKVEEIALPPENVSSIPLPPEPYKGSSSTLSFTISRTKESAFKAQSKDLGKNPFHASLKSSPEKKDSLSSTDALKVKHAES